MFEFSSRDLLETLPRILRRTAMNSEYTGESCDLLWKLGRNDQRELNRYPDHAVRVLQDLASYEYLKPVWFNEAVLEMAEAWINDPALATYAYSPLDVIDRLLAKHGEYHELEGYSIKLGTFQINVDAVKRVRDRAIECVRKCLSHSHPRVVVRALKSLQQVVSHPAAIFARQITQNEYDQWGSEQLKETELLSSFVGGTTDPVLLAHVLHEFRWLAKNGHPAGVRDAVDSALAKIPRSLGLRLGMAFTAGLFDIGLEDPVGSSTQQTKFLQELSEEFLSEFEGDSAILKLESVIEAIRSSGFSLSSRQLPLLIASESPDFGMRFIRHILDHEACALRPFAPAVLHGLRSKKPADTMLLLNGMSESKDTDILRGVAEFYLYSDWLHNPRDGDFKVIEKLLAAPDRDSKRLALEALKRLKGVEPPERRLETVRIAIKLLLAVDIGADGGLAESLCEALDEQFGISLDGATDDDIKGLLRKLVPVRDVSIQAFHFGRFLGSAAKRDPEAVVSYLLDRIEFDVTHQEMGPTYSAVPFELDTAASVIRNHKSYPSVLHRLVEDLNRSEGLKAYWLTKLFQKLAGGFGPEAIDVIKLLAESNRESSYKVLARLLAEAPRNFPFDQKELCAHLLETSFAISEEAHRRIRGALFSSTESGAFTAAPGRPSPRHTQVREQANKLAEEFAARPAVANFYGDLAKAAQRTIDAMLERDEEFLLE
jgi:hypothetical protein